MRNWQKLGIFILAAAVILFLEYHFYFNGRFNESSNLKKELVSLDLEIALIKPKEIFNLDLISSRKYLKTETDEINKKLPFVDDIPRLINDFINGTSNKLDINYELIRPALPVPDGRYKRLSIELGLSTDFMDMVKYLENIENTNPLIREDSFELNNGKDSLNINIKMSISTFLNQDTPPEHEYFNLSIVSPFTETQEAVQSPVKKSKRTVILPHFKGIYKSLRTKAFIDDSLLGVGQTIKGYLLEEISERYVIVSYAYKRYTLKLGR